MAEPFDQRLRENGQTVIDIVQQALTSGTLRIDSDEFKRALYVVLKKIILSGGGVTITNSDSGSTITIKVP